VLRPRWLSPTLLNSPHGRGLALVSLLALSGASAPACGGSQAQAPAEAEPASDPTEQTTSKPSPEPVVVAEPVAEPPPPADPWGPISEDQETILWAGDEETRINTPEHYVKTNERRHDVWFPYIADKRGIYVGVAADQNYTLMAVAKAEFAFLVDLDWRVTELHRAYEVLIEASEDPKTLHGRFLAKNEEESVKLIEEGLADLDPEIRRQAIISWRAARETVYLHLENVIARDQDGVPTSWLSNADYYAHVRKLYLNDRIRMLVGDLTGPKTVQTVASAAKGLGLPVKVLYLSNAEEYYDYTSQYRSNIAALEIADDSVVLRTIYSKEWVHADALWNYQVQPLSDYQARLTDKKNSRRNSMLRHAEVADQLEKNDAQVSGLSRVNIATLPGWGEGSGAEAAAQP
jgi:hypothetical protein